MDLVIMTPFENLSLCDIINEEWKGIENSEGRYFVSNLGRVKSVLWYY